MAHSIVMPALELAQETGKVLGWRKKEGDAVSQGEPLLDIETDKAVFEIDSPATGILTGVVALEGAIVPVGQTIAWIVQPGENPPSEASSSARRSGMPQTSSSLPSATAKLPGEEVSSEIKISPKARRLAREHDIDLARVRGSGENGEILTADIMSYVTPGETTSNVEDFNAPVTSNPIARLMAERTLQSWTSVPHFFVFREIDAAGILEARERQILRLDSAQETRFTLSDILVSVTARVLLKHRHVNAAWISGEIQFHQQVNIGLAIAVEQGVVNVVIPVADSKSLMDIAGLRRELTERARAGRSRPEDLRAATFTISNLGMYNVDAFTAIIPAPQAAILAVGRVADRVVAVNGIPVVRPVMTVALSCDHRVLDGARASKFLEDFAKAVTQPEKWAK